MNKYLVTFEFRYRDEPDNEGRDFTPSKILTVGVYDTFEEACKHGNSYLEVLEGKFPLHIFPNGSQSAKARFSLKGGCFGSKLDLITNLAYLKTPFEFYAKITTLNFYDFSESVTEVMAAVERFKSHKMLEYYEDL